MWVTQLFVVGHILRKLASPHTLSPPTRWTVCSEIGSPDFVCQSDGLHRGLWVGAGKGRKQEDFYLDLHFI